MYLILIFISLIFSSTPPPINHKIVPEPVENTGTLLPKNPISGKKIKNHFVKYTIRFNHTTVYVQDLAISTRFYSDVMSLEPIPEPFHDQKHSWYSIGPHIQLHVVQGAVQKIPHDVNIHLAFSVEDLPAFMEHLKQLGIPYGDFTAKNGKTAKRPDGIEQIYLQDPDGYWIEVNNNHE
jgi:lactoylglutathione lyase